MTFLPECAKYSDKFLTQAGLLRLNGKMCACAKYTTGGDNTAVWTFAEELL